MKEIGSLRNERLFRMNFSLLMVKDDVVIFGVKDLDKSFKLPSDFILKLNLIEIKDSASEDDLVKQFSYLHDRLESFKQRQDTEEKRKEFIFGKDTKRIGSDRVIANQKIIDND